MDYMPKTNDITLVVLKDHLLMEEAIRDLLNSLVANPSEIKAANLRLAQLISITRAILPADLGDTFQAADKLNKLRNKLAHHLEPPDLDRHIDIFLGNFKNLFEEDRIGPAPLYKRLNIAISYLCGSLTGLRESLEATGVKLALRPAKLPASNTDLT